MTEMEKLRLKLQARAAKQEPSHMSPVEQMFSRGYIDAESSAGNPSQAPSKHTHSSGTARPSTPSATMSSSPSTLFTPSPSTVFTPSPSTAFSSSPTTVSENESFNPNSPPLTTKAERSYRKRMPNSPSNANALGIDPPNSLSY